MIGHPDRHALTEWPLPALLADLADTAPQECVNALRNAATTIVVFRHADGFGIHTVISQPLLTRADDVLLISITDVTELHWNTRPPDH
jgi:hypothetical protein